MALTVTSPQEYSAAYNPVIVKAQSDVRDDFTIGAAKTVTVVTSASGFASLTFSANHGLIKGDYILITSAPDASSILGIALVTSVPTLTSLVINKAFSTGISSNGTAYKYISNYSCLTKFFVYYSSAPLVAVQVASKTLKPKFENGFCVFYIDLAGLIQSYNFEGDGVDDVLSSDIYVGGGGIQVNEKSFVKYGFECFEAFDNPVGGIPSYVEEGDVS